MADLKSVLPPKPEGDNNGLLPYNTRIFNKTAWLASALPAILPILEKNANGERLTPAEIADVNTIRGAGMGLMLEMEHVRDTQTGRDKAREEAFDRVKNKKDWKAPINIVIPTPTDREIADIAEAISHYTSTEAAFEPGPKPGTIRVRAVGYRMGPAGDH